MHARVVLGVGKGVLFREVSSVQGCPYRNVPLYCLLSAFCVLYMATSVKKSITIV